MTIFTDREKGFEDRFAHDDTMNFKARARRNRLLGEWVASELLDLSGDAVAAYAADVVSADLEEHGDADVVRKVHADLEAKGVDFSDHRIEKKLEAMMVEAKKQVMDEV
jgi:hypothetical protein